MATGLVHTLWERVAVDPFHTGANTFFASLQALTRETTATSYLTFECGLGLALAMLSLAQLSRKGWTGRQSRGQARVVNDMLQAVGRVKSGLPPAKSRSVTLAWPAQRITLAAEGMSEVVERNAVSWAFAVFRQPTISTS